MTQEGNTAHAKPFWKKAIKPAVLVIVGIIIAFPIFSITDSTMARTSTRSQAIQPEQACQHQLNYVEAGSLAE